MKKVLVGLVIAGFVGIGGYIVKKENLIKKYEYAQENKVLAPLFKANGVDKFSLAHPTQFDGVTWDNVNSKKMGPQYNIRFNLAIAYKELHEEFSGKGVYLPAHSQVNITMSNIPAPFKNEDNSGIWGYAAGMFDDKIDIILDKEVVEIMITRSEDTRRGLKFLLLHELAHDYFNLQHDHNSALMNPKTTVGKTEKELDNAIVELAFQVLTKKQ